MNGIIIIYPICNDKMKISKTLWLRHIPHASQTMKKCMRAVYCDGGNIAHIAPKFRTKELCDIAFNKSKKPTTPLQIPAYLRSSDIWRS